MKDNLHLFGKKNDDEPNNDTHQNDSNPPNDGPINEGPDMVFTMVLGLTADGQPTVQVDGHPTLTDMQMLLYRALKGVELRIASETTCAMMAQVLGVGQQPYAIDPTGAN